MSNIFLRRFKYTSLLIIHFKEYFSSYTILLQFILNVKKNERKMSLLIIPFSIAAHWNRRTYLEDNFYRERYYSSIQCVSCDVDVDATGIVGCAQRTVIVRLDKQKLGICTSTYVESRGGNVISCKTDCVRVSWPGVDRTSTSHSTGTRCTFTCTLYQFWN